MRMQTVRLLHLLNYHIMRTNVPLTHTPTTHTHTHTPHANTPHTHTPHANTPHTHTHTHTHTYSVPEEEIIEKEFANLTIKDFTCVETLGMGGFGRVELVITMATRLLTYALIYSIFIASTGSDPQRPR